MGQLLIALLVNLAIFAATSSAVPDKWFVGWKGATYNPEVVWKSNSDNEPAKVASEVSTNWDWTPKIVPTAPWVEQLSWQPRSFLFHNFLSAEECEHIIKVASPFMKRSTVVSTGNTSVTDNIRTSYGTFLRRYQDDVIGEIEERLANWTHLPAVNQEDMQVLRYSVGQKYGAHIDVLDEPVPRYATVLLYLNDVEQGGETAFPMSSAWLNPALAQKYDPWSDCAKGHVAVKPKKGDALLFYSLKLDNARDLSSKHTGCPILAGVKWTATKWIHVGPFREAELLLRANRKAPKDPGLCFDDDSRCTQWASAGECTKNAEYMIGENSSLTGACRKACGICEACDAQDYECYKRNRERSGYLILDQL